MAKITVFDKKENLLKALAEIGLTDKEAELYTLSLQLGPVNTSLLAESLVIPRPNVYKLIQGLESHGLARPAHDQRRRHTFMVESPAIVGELLQKKRDALQDVSRKVLQDMPNLLASYRQGDLPTSIRIFEGKYLYKKVFFQLLDEAKDDIQFFGSADTFLHFFTKEEQLEWTTERLKHNLSIRTLILPWYEAKAFSQRDEQDKRETRVFTGVDYFRVAFHLFGNKIIIWQPTAQLAVKIEDELIVQMFKNLYEYFWSQSARPASP